jgi:hypothetical protein
LEDDMFGMKSVMMVSAAALLLAGTAAFGAETRGAGSPGFTLDSGAGFHVDGERGPSVGGDLGSVADDRRFDDLESDDDGTGDTQGAPFDTARCNPDRRDYSALDCRWRQ